MCKYRETWIIHVETAVWGSCHPMATSKNMASDIKCSRSVNFMPEKGPVYCKFYNLKPPTFAVCKYI